MEYIGKDKMLLCGSKNINIFDGSTPAEIFVVDIFKYNFCYYMYNMFEEFEDDFKT